MNNINGTLKAWLPDHSSLSPDQIATPEALESLVFTKHCMRSAGWTYVGDATIKVDVILSPEQLIASKIETLKAQQHKIRGEAQERVNELERMVQNLLAITYVSEA
jgi:hypothetical protein